MRTLPVIILTLVLNISHALAEKPQNGSLDLPSDLTSVGLQELLGLDLIVTSPGKKEQPIAEVASAIFVLSSEDIVRSGATHIAEALRLVPGVAVARASSNQWAVSVRGFNQIFSNKLLVLIDGVSVFSPTTNGVYWQSIDLPLEDVARIEVIRGPGAALWGANAVNGVINIITKESSKTQGTLISAGGGTHDEAFGLVRQGGAIDPGAFYRLFAKYSSRGSNRSLDGSSAHDDWESGAAGLRIDRELAGADGLLFTADASQQNENAQPLTPALDPPYLDPIRFRDVGQWRSAKSLLEWRTHTAEDSAFKTSISAVLKERDSALVSFDYQTYNFDMQHQVRVMERHDLVYGLSYRIFDNSAQGSVGHEVLPASRHTDLFTGFLQDEITLQPERWKLTLGSKFEHNDHTGGEVMPNARILYLPGNSTTVWASVAGATAPPAIFFEDTIIPVAAFPVPEAGLPGVATIYGNRGIESEILLAYEAGIRSQLSQSVFGDLALFYSTHDHIFGQEPGIPFVQMYGDSGRPALIIPLNLANRLEGESFGAELAMSWKPLPRFSMGAAYSFMDVRISLDGGSDSANQSLIEGGSPQNQFVLNSRVDITDDVGLDANVRYVDHLSFGSIDSYIEGTARIAWQVTRSTELSLVGQNLFHSAHSEFQANLFGPPRTEIERAVYGVVKVQF